MMLFLILVLSRMQKNNFNIFFCHYYKVKAADEQGPFFGETKTAQTMAEKTRSRNHGLGYSRTGS